ncbi:aminoglycoside phosphotransferase family protein [Kribbella sp. NPDC056861]|uniref:aminoglycoside phosphotransferase family protein n=1 Tax=Kribbella sp. NPDC056861 TaxID=3154857 RepID=UPI00343049CE
MPRTDEPLDAQDAFAALTAAAGQVDLDATGAELIRIGSNAVYRLTTGPVIGRVAPSLKRLESAVRELEVSWWLESEGISAVRGLHIDQPITANERVVTFWQSASEKTEYGSTTELAGLLRELHRHVAPLELPRHDPVHRGRERIAAITALSTPDLEFLRSRLEELAVSYQTLRFDLPFGIIHGDANVGNVIRDRTGTAILADLDSVAVGPREWDLILTALYYERFGWHSDAEYAAFVDGYGFDVMAWSGYRVMRDLRELLMVAWLAESITGERGRLEITKRVQTLRTDGSRRDWQPF